MSAKQAHLNDGTILEFPADTPDDVIDNAVRAHISTPSSDSRIGGLVSGALKPADNLASWASEIPVIGPAVDQLGEAFGMPSAKQAAIENSAYRDANSRKGWQSVGNFLGTLPTAAVPGGVLAQGAASGALLSDKADLGGIATDATIGAVTSKIGEKALAALGSVIAPKLSPEIRRLADAGVRGFTPGQFLHDSKGPIGRTFHKIEEAATSIPGVGDLIDLARTGGTESYERALGNRVLGNIRQQLPDGIAGGEDIVGYAKGKVGEAYDKLVPKLSLTFDQDFADGLTAAKDMVSTLPDTVQKQFEGIVRNAFTNRAQGSTMAGQPLKDAEAYLTKQIRTYMPKGGDHAILAEAVDGVRQALRGGITKANQTFGDELQALNKAWAQLRPMKIASESNSAGQITPARMFQESRKTGFSDPLVKAGDKVMRNRTPESGTGRRAMVGAGAITAGTAGLSVLSPSLAVPAVASALYLPKAIQIINQLALAKRGKASKAVGDGLRWLADHSGPIGPALGGAFKGD